LIGTPSATVQTRLPIASRPVSATGYKTIFSFNGSGGAKPYGNLLVYNGALYGTTADGGANGDGTVFKLTTSGKETVLYSFRGGADGMTPEGGLAELNGKLYGTTYEGGASSCEFSGHGCGIVFEISTSGKERVLHAFTGGVGGNVDGSFPGYGSLQVLNGTLYGMTGLGGEWGHGTVFGITPSGKETLSYSFGYGRERHKGQDGAIPLFGLTAVHGVLFGMTQYGGGFRYGRDGSCGGFGCGTIFKLSTSGRELSLHRFKGAPQGENPVANVLYVRGKLYGVTGDGGTYGGGTAFATGTSLRKAVTFHSFQGAPDGDVPSGVLVSSNGVLYGTTEGGGSPECTCGTIFAFTSSGTENILHDFGSASGDGSDPVGGLIELDGVLYGTTTNGGADGYGTVFALKEPGKR
jgi:uncharacterized repeat protein (TIGR03803 family)